jgi:AcrR family transcriptional regulator
MVRLESDGTEALSLREIARDVGVNHRAVYRHFPDKLSLLARVAEEGWRRLAGRMRRQVGGEKPGARDSRCLRIIAIRAGMKHSGDGPSYDEQ